MNEERMAFRSESVKHAKIRRIMMMAFIIGICIGAVAAVVVLVGADSVQAADEGMYAAFVGITASANISESAGKPDINMRPVGTGQVNTAPQEDKLPEGNGDANSSTPSSPGIQGAPTLTVFIDAGHGGNDAGAVSGSDYEKDFNLDMALKLGELLEAADYTVVYIRDHDEYFSLTKRVKAANESGADLFISIHCNSSTVESPYGLETFYPARDKNGASKHLAELVHNSILKHFDTRDRGITSGDYYVIRKTTMPAILIETAYISNPEDRAKLKDVNCRQAIAQGIADAVFAYAAEMIPEASEDTEAGAVVQGEIKVEVTTE